MAKDTEVLQEGDTTKTNPFTVCIVANPWLEDPLGSGRLIADPIVAPATATQPSGYVDFVAAANLIANALTGTVPGEKADLFGPLSAKFVIVRIYDDTLPATSPNSLVGHRPGSNILAARRTVATAFCQSYGYTPDIVYAVSKSTTNTRASAWPATDDPARGSNPFTLDGVALQHCWYSQIPGTIALHVTGLAAPTVLHEFGHAISSYSNGTILDLYVDNTAGVNNKQRPVAGSAIPGIFGTYGLTGATSYNSDMSRDALGYPPFWFSYHAEFIDPSCAALMDDYWSAKPSALSSQNDRITDAFIRDRVQVKLSR